MIHLINNRKEPRTNDSSLMSVRRAVAIVLVMIVSHVSPVQAFADQHVSFIKPLLRVELSAKEAGRIEEVFVKIGDHVHRGDLLIRLDDELHTIAERSAAAEAQDRTEIERLELQLKSDREHAAKVNDLIDRGAVSPEELREAELNVAIHEVALRAAKNQWQKRSLQAQEAMERLERRRVKTPVDGVVVDIVAKPGEYISAATPHLLTIVQLDRLKATFFLPPPMVEGVHCGHHATLQLAAGKTTIGSVDYVSPITEADSGLVRVDVTIDNRSAAYRAGERTRLVRFQSPETLPSRAPPQRVSGKQASGRQVSGKNRAPAAAFEPRSNPRPNPDLIDLNPPVIAGRPEVHHGR